MHDMQNTLKEYDMYDMQTIQGKHGQHSKPVGQVKVKKNKLGTNNLEKQVTTTQSKTQLVLSQNHKGFGICQK